jgi:hypothetical protein
MVFVGSSAIRITALSAIIRTNKERDTRKHQAEMGGECCKRRDEEENIRRFGGNS